LSSLKTCLHAVKNILENLPSSWVELTTHRLDIYNEAKAKSQFLQQLTSLQASGDYSRETLESLPTAYDYIRLGHPLSSVLEWLLAEINGLTSEQVITFDSNTMPILAILRKNAINNKVTNIYYDTDSSPLIDTKRLQSIYGYQFEQHKIDDANAIPNNLDGTVLFVTQSPYKDRLDVKDNIDVTVNLHPHYGSTLMIHNNPLRTDEEIEVIVNEVQHVRRRETISMTPINALNVLNEVVNSELAPPLENNTAALNKVFDAIKQNTGATENPLIASSGLSIQYAILMGLVENALIQYPNKPIKIVLPPNCYGGTNDQARRIGDLIPQVEITDLLVDGGQDLVTSLEVVLNDIAELDSVPIVLAEIPTNPRVEVPDMTKLGETLSAIRKSSENKLAVAPVFMVDQTFCPNVKLLHQQSDLARVKIVSFSSGSKFPSGGRCIAGYCAVNDTAKDLIKTIAHHLTLSENDATPHQVNTLAENMPSMPERIKKAYENTRTFVNHVQNTLPQSKINFVSDELAEQGFTPSVFSLDLPSTGETIAERENNKRLLNKKLIDFMIEKHPKDCKYCVSYGQLKGSYWTIPATSTQGTTKEGDKDYIVRVALSPDCDTTKLSGSFTEFCLNEKFI